MILKRQFNPIKVLSYVHFEIIFTLLVSLFVFGAHHLGWIHWVLPFSVSAILGSALAIFIAFRNNSAYARWWDARTQWGSIVNASRVLGRLIITFADSHQHQTNYNRERSEEFKREMIYLLMAWAHTLRMSLRQQQDWDTLSKYMSQDEFTGFFQAQHKTNYLQLLFGRKIYSAMADGTLAGFDSFQMEGQLLVLANCQGACERIKNTPLLRQYDFFNRLFLYTFILLLPFSLYSDFEKLNMDVFMVPISVVIAFVFAIMSKVGEVNEDPFENKITDVPMSAICIQLERDLREYLGESELPPRKEIENGYLY